MDTLTHTLMGGTLVGLATIDPNIDAISAGFIATAVGASLVPDIDTVMKMKNNAVYITHHRGITHSLPFTFLIWPVLLTLIAHFAFGLPFLNTYLWVQLAVFLHVFVDIFNSYGTQALRPLDNTWIQLGTINTVDIPILIVHGLYFVLWFIGFSPVALFFAMYAFLILYYITRYFMQRFLIRKVHKQLPNEKVIRTFVMPTLHFNQWRIIAVTETAYYVGRSFQSNIIFYDRFKREDYLPNEIFMAIKHDKNFKAFTFFSSIYRYELTSLDTETFELRYIDLRYLKEGHYPFVCIMHLDKKTYEVSHSYTGWVFTEDKLQRKLQDN